MAEESQKPRMREAALEHTKTTLVSFLRAFLGNYDNYKEFCEKDFSDVEIWVTKPEHLRSWPMIVVSGAPGQMITTGLSDLMETLYDVNGTAVGYRFGGIYEFSMQVDLATKSTLDRDQLTDLVALTYRLLLRRYMEQNGVLVVNMNYSGQSEQPYNADMIYFGTLTFTTWSEWYEDVPFLPAADITLQVKETPQ